MGQTALFLVGRNGHARCCRLLLYAGSDPNCKDFRGDTALSEAESKGHSEIAALLRDPPAAEAAPPQQPAPHEGVPSAPEPQPESPLDTVLAIGAREHGPTMSAEEPSDEGFFAEMEAEKRVGKGGGKGDGLFDSRLNLGRDFED